MYMKSKILRIVLIVMTVSLIGILATGCAGQSKTAAPTSQTAVVQKGSITVSITGTGNLALKNKQSLSFGQTGQANNATTAKISEVNVSAGQIVEKGQVLVKADTADWTNQLTLDQHNLDTTRAGVDSAKIGLDSARAAVDQAKASLIQAQANLQMSQYNLSMQADIKAIQEKIDNTNIQVVQAKQMLTQTLSQGDTAGGAYWQGIINYLSVDTQYQNLTPHVPDGGQLGFYTKQMNTVLTDPAHAGAAVSTSVADINTKTLAVQTAQAAVTNAQNNVTAAQNSILAAQNNVILAQNKQVDAQRVLDEDTATPQEIKAPFSGLITKVWIDTNGNKIAPGAIVARNTSLMEIAEADKFVANILVSERDVTSLVIGGEAVVTFNALPGLSFPAKITVISSLASIQQGVVNYNITLELTSNSPLASSGKTSGGTTQVNLKDGFSALVNLPVVKKDNILVVPSRAISFQGQNYVVQVENGTGSETRIVKIGITDYQNTEILEGLNVGDRVILPVIPTAAPTTSGGIFGGGGG
jgi:multidrug efflux pump subunit AcrA (membrane-fusion protein)